MNLFFLQYLFEKDIKRYDLIVEGKLDDYTGAKVKVKIHVNGTEPDINGRYFTVLIYDGLSLGHVVFDLRNRYQNGVDTTFRFQMVSYNNYFGVRDDSGQVYVKSKLPRPASKRDVWKQNLEVCLLLLCDNSSYSLVPNNSPPAY